jgi:hypothetical protein
MVSAEGYLQKALESKQFCFRYRLLKYMPGIGELYDRLNENMRSIIVNSCKAVFAASKIPIGNKSDEEIINYVAQNYKFGEYVRSWVQNYNLWVLWSKRHSERDRNKYLRNTMIYTEYLDVAIRQAFNIPGHNEYYYI